MDRILSMAASLQPKPVSPAPRSSIASAIRPSVRPGRLTADWPGIQILGKAEWTNPGGSVKDRAAAANVLDALNASSYAPACASSTPPVAIPASPTLCSARLLRSPSPSSCPNVSPERKRILNAYGAEIVWTDPAESLTAPSAKPASWQPTRNISTPISTVIQPTGAPTTPAPATDPGADPGRITHFVAGLGTTGT